MSGLFSSVHAILQTRTPQGAIAWAVAGLKDKGVITDAEFEAQKARLLS